MKQGWYLSAVATLVLGCAMAADDAAPKSDAEKMKSIEADPGSDASFEALDKKPADVLKHMEKQPMPWINGYVGFKPALVEQWGISGFPGLFVLDADGVIRARPGELDDKTKEYVRTLVAVLVAQKQPR